MNKLPDEKKRCLKSLALILSGSLLSAESVYAFRYSKMNLGVVMPLIIGLPLVLDGAFQKQLKSWQARHVSGRVFKRCFAGAYILFALLFTATTTLILVSSGEPENAAADAVIVLGAGFRKNSPSLTLKGRLDRAVRYSKEFPDALIVVSGGQGRDEPRTEASLMKEYLVANGVAADRIVEEGRSRSTVENFRFSREIICGRLGKDAATAFITTDFHLFRAKRTAKAMGLDAVGIPAPGNKKLAINNCLRECAAITRHFLGGTL